MGAAVALRDVICETANILMITVIPPHGGIDGNPVFLGMDINRPLKDGGFIGVEMADKGFNAAFIIKLCDCLLYTSPSPRDQRGSRMPSSA